jgi:RNA polymerase sigma-70 factor, ECF subfamily
MRKVRLRPAVGQQIDPSARCSRSARSAMVAAGAVESAGFSGCPPVLGARRPPAEHAHKAPAFPAVAEVMDEVPHVRRYMGGAGALPDDLDDLMQEVAIGAFRAIAAGRYRPDPTAEPRLVLRFWLIGIAFRQFSRLRQRAYRRHEVLCWDPCRGHESTQHPGPQCDARDALAALQVLPRWAREVLLHVGQGLTIPQIAALRGLPDGTVSTRLRSARARFAALLARSERFAMPRLT